MAARAADIRSEDLIPFILISPSPRRCNLLRSRHKTARPRLVRSSTRRCGVCLRGVRCREPPILLPLLLARRTLITLGRCVGLLHRRGWLRCRSNPRAHPDRPRAWSACAHHDRAGGLDLKRYRESRDAIRHSPVDRRLHHDGRTPEPGAGGPSGGRPKNPASALTVCHPQNGAICLLQSASISTRWPKIKKPHFPCQDAARGFS